MVDVDVMLAMATSIHSKAAPIITEINLEYMRPYFKRKKALRNTFQRRLGMKRPVKLMWF